MGGRARVSAAVYALIRRGVGATYVIRVAMAVWAVVFGRPNSAAGASRAQATAVAASFAGAVRAEVSTAPIYTPVLAVEPATTRVSRRKVSTEILMARQCKIRQSQSIWNTVRARYQPRLDGIKFRVSVSHS